MKKFKEIRDAGLLSPIDLAVSRFLANRASPEHAEIVALTAALLSSRRRSGHSCITPREWAGKPFPDERESNPVQLPRCSPTGPAPGDRRNAPLEGLPDADEWETVLGSSPLVSDGSHPAPLVRDRAGRVYFYRYFIAERRLAALVASRLGDGGNGDMGLERLKRLIPLFRALFAPLKPDEVNWQAAAAAAALANRFLIVTGGPGTGKTTTVARLLALFRAHDPDLRVALAAPTGKAAQRLTESIRQQSESLNVSEPIAPPASDTEPGHAAESAGPGSGEPPEAMTIHRLLGYLPSRDVFRFGPRRPLTTDLLIVDEASMVDLLLMEALFSALPLRSRIILLGDENQLASVETGFVLGDLCAAAGPGDRFSKPFSKVFELLSGQSLPVDAEAGPLEDAVIRLRTSYRFIETPGIGALAEAVQAGEAARSVEILTGADSPETVLEPYPEDGETVLEPVFEAIESCVTASTPEEGISRLGGFRILCALRRGPRGVEGLNALVERRLRRRGHPGTGGPAPGRPVMITTNDYSLRLFNGDLGICWPDGPRLSACFPGESGELRRFPLGRLPAHELAWAMTIHKSQGSEFDEILLILPVEMNPVLTRELIYTGLTRARRAIHIRGDADLVQSAVNSPAHRGSGLTEALCDLKGEKP